MDVLAIDIGGSHVKFAANTRRGRAEFDSTRRLTARSFARRVRDSVRGWRFDVVSIGYPGIVGANGPAKEPGHLGRGWVGFDFAAAFGKPVRVVNDAVAHALGSYDGGRMLFLGLGTGLGSALVSEHVVIPMELGDLSHAAGGTLGDRLGRRGLETYGRRDWRETVSRVVPELRDALAADYVVLGGGNASYVTPLPSRTRRAPSDGAFKGGFRLWEEMVEPHDRAPALTWRVVR
jgi:polyphosphate glucokinase